MRADELVTRAIVTIDPAATLVEAARTMAREAVGALVVVEHGRLAGIVTDRDITVRGVAQRYPVDARVDSVMSTDVRAVTGEADVEAVCRVLGDHDVRRVVVVDGGTPVGVVTADDVLLALSRTLGDLARPLAAQVAGEPRDADVPSVRA